MVNGPPTPPATTSTELLDAERITLPVADRPAADTLAATPIQNDNILTTEVYQRVRHVFGSAIAQKDYQSLVRAAEEADILTSNDHQTERMLIVAPLVLAHLINDTIPPARYALLRLPGNLASLPLTKALSALLVSTMNRQNSQVYEQTASLTSLVLQQDFFDKDFVQQIVDLSSAFLEQFRHRTISLLSKAYISLPLSSACNYLGLPGENVVNAAEKYGWSYDSSLQVLYPKQEKAAVIPMHSSLGFSSLSTFQQVADSVARLEG